MKQERDLAASGELRKTSKMHKGQMVAADYILSPSVTFSNNNAGGAGAMLGGLLGSVGAMVGGSMSTKEASTLITLVDTRSGVQLAAAEGISKEHGLRCDWWVVCRRWWWCRRRLLKYRPMQGRRRRLYRRSQ